MAEWFGSFQFVLLSALGGCILGFGIAAIMRSFKNRKSGRKN